MDTKKLEDIYYNPTTGYTGFDKFYNKVKQTEPDFTRKTVKEWYDNQEIVQRSKKAITTKNKMLKIVGPPLSFQIDLMYINKALKNNDSDDFYKFLLCIDIVSRKAYIYRIKDKKQDTVLSAYKIFLEDLEKDIGTLKDSYDEYTREIPVQITSDDGFKFKLFVDYNNKLNIMTDTQTSKDDHISGGNRLGIIDRLVRTLRNIMTKYIYATNEYGSVNDIMKYVIDNYNNTQHRSLYGYTPIQVFNSKDLRYKVMNDTLQINKNIFEKLDNTDPIRINDTVRIFEEKGQFTKERPNFSKELYTVVEIKGNKYKVANNNKIVLKRNFKLQEIQKLNEKNIQRKAVEDAQKVVANTQTKKQVKKALKREGIDVSNIVRGKRKTSTV